MPVILLIWDTLRGCSACRGQKTGKNRNQRTQEKTL